MASTYPQDNEIPASYEVIYDVGFKIMFFDEALSTIITMWNSKSATISVEDYKKDAEDTVELIRNTDAHYLITDHRENKFNISPDLQKWYAELIAHVLGNGRLEKCAVIITTDLNLLSALEEIKTNIQQMEGEIKIAYRFFSDFKEAEKWIHTKAV